MKKNSTFITPLIYISIFFIIVILFMTIIFKNVTNQIYNEVVLKKDLIYELRHNVQDVTRNLIQHNKDLTTQKSKYYNSIWKDIYMIVDELKENEDRETLSYLELSLTDLKDINWWIKEFSTIKGNEQAKYIQDKNIQRVISNIHKILAYISSLNLTNDDLLKLKNISMYIDKIDLFVIKFIYREDKKYIKKFSKNIQNIQKLIEDLNKKNTPFLGELKREINSYIYYFDIIIKIDSTKNSYSDNLMQKEFLPVVNEVLKILDSMLEIKNEILRGNLEFKNIFGNILIISFVALIAFILFILKYISKQKYKIEKYIDIVDKNVITSTTNIDGIITNASEAFSKISGYSKDELVGSNHNIIKHPDMPIEIFTKLWWNIKRGKSWDGEIKNLKKDKNFYWVKVHISPIFDKKHKITGYTSIRQDITDKKMIEDVLII